MADGLPLRIGQACVRVCRFFHNKTPSKNCSFIRQNHYQCKPTLPPTLIVLTSWRQLGKDTRKDFRHKLPVIVDGAEWLEETPCHLAKWCRAPLITTLSTFPSFALHSSALMHKLVTPSFLPATCNIFNSQSFVQSTTSSISLLGSTQSTGLVSLAIEAIDAPSAPVPPI